MVVNWLLELKLLEHICIKIFKKHPAVTYHYDTTLVRPGTDQQLTRKPGDQLAAAKDGEGGVMVDGVCGGAAGVEEGDQAVEVQGTAG